MGKQGDILTLKKLTPMVWFVILAVITICLALGLPPDPHAVQQLNTSETTYRIALATLLIPYVIIWYASFYAFAKLREYSKPLRSTKDGAAFHTITTGAGILAFSLVVPTAISLTLTSIAGQYPSFRPAAIVINNYLSLFPGLLAFLLLYNGSRVLIATVRSKAREIDLRWHAPWFFVLCAVFAHLTIENQYKQNPYHLSVWLLVITYIVPYLYGWMVGLLCAYNLRVYADTVRGLLYQQAVRQFANGVGVAITASIAIQFVNITIAHRLSTSLGSLLLIDYGLLVIIILGLALMALGTSKLKKIEEV